METFPRLKMLIKIRMKWKIWISFPDPVKNSILVLRKINMHLARIMLTLPVWTFLITFRDV